MEKNHVIRWVYPSQTFCTMCSVCKSIYRMS